MDLESIIKKLQLPFFIIIGIALIFVLIQLSQAYSNYWEGRLAKERAKELGGDVDKLEF